MRTVGIIAEFNPFHNGHRYLLEKAREITGADFCIVIMSGDFVQRGAPAICSKYLRAETALNGGADIVFELPAIYSLSSAEQFAYGAVSLLCSLLNIDYICFGSESGDLTSIEEIAKFLEETSHTPDFRSGIKNAIKNGMSYPKAFSYVLKELMHIDTAPVASPNSLLGIEYCRSLLRIKKSGLYPKIPIPVTINRLGSDYSENWNPDEPIKEYASASVIRDCIFYSYNSVSARIHPELALCMPEKAFDTLSYAFGRNMPVSEDDFSDMLYLRLNSLGDDEILHIPDINPDLLHRILGYKNRKIVFREFAESLKTKCFTYSSISRALVKILLSPAYTSAFNACKENSMTPYLKLLGFKKNASVFLRSLRDSETCRIITKPSKGDLTDHMYKLDIYASNLYEQVCSGKYKTGFTSEIKTGPVIL